MSFRTDQARSAVGPTRVRRWRGPGSAARFGPGPGLGLGLVPEPVEHGEAGGVGVDAAIVTGLHDVGEAGLEFCAGGPQGVLGGEAELLAVADEDEQEVAEFFADMIEIAALAGPVELFP